MIEIEFNGETLRVDDACTIQDLLSSTHVEPRFCAVEVNLEIVSQIEYETYCIQPGDKIEVVTLVGGG